ncbi:thiol-disulfide oxidoreductase DCC family protein [Kocuria sp. CPCC 205231]|uniref:thiol-disulfide oxidoreductase DCC family protein n=1 Tax=Kocuria sp. CPCC 205231 TaxID=3073551 RepID=UPI0034D66636
MKCLGKANVRHLSQKYSITSRRSSVKQTLIYDADCGFCTRSAEWLAKTKRVQIMPWQQLNDLSTLGLSEEKVSSAAYWIDENAKLHAGASAIAQALLVRGGVWAGVGQAILVSPVLVLANVAYKFIAKNRHAMPGGGASCRIPK